MSQLSRIDRFRAELDQELIEIQSTLMARMSEAIRVMPKGDRAYIHLESLANITNVVRTSICGDD